LRQSLGITKVVTTPTLDSRNGVFGPVDPTVLRFVNAFYRCQPAFLRRGQLREGFLFSGQQVTHENYYTTRVDHHFTNANTMAGTYVFDVADIEQPDEMNNKSTGFDTRRQIFTLEDTHIFGPRLVNAIRFGISRVVANGGNTSLTNNPAAGDVSYGIVPGKFAPRRSKYQESQNSLVVWHRFPPITSIGHPFRAYDDAFLSLGFSFGEIRNCPSSVFGSNESAFTDPTGVFGYSSLDEFFGETGLLIPSPPPFRTPSLLVDSDRL